MKNTQETVNGAVEAMHALMQAVRGNMLRHAVKERQARAFASAGDADGYGAPWDNLPTVERMRRSRRAAEER